MSRHVKTYKQSIVIERKQAARARPHQLGTRVAKPLVPFACGLLFLLPRSPWLPQAVPLTFQLLSRPFGLPPRLLVAFQQHSLHCRWAIVTFGRGWHLPRCCWHLTRCWRWREWRRKRYDLLCFTQTPSHCATIMLHDIRALILCLMIRRCVDCAFSQECC